MRTARLHVVGGRRGGRHSDQVPPGSRGGGGEGVDILTKSLHLVRGGGEVVDILTKSHLVRGGGGGRHSDQVPPGPGGGEGGRHSDLVPCCIWCVTYPPPPGVEQTNACENITFARFATRAVNIDRLIKGWIVGRKDRTLEGRTFFIYKVTAGPNENPHPRPHPRGKFQSYALLQLSTQFW